MPEGTCKKCGRKYAGWALKQREYLTCKCGGKIEVWSANDRVHRNERLPKSRGRIEVALRTTQYR
jgi:hypothetical protein